MTAERQQPRQNKQKKHAAWWRRGLLIFLGILLGVSAYLANAQALGGNQLPMPFGYGAAVVLSGSMEPTFSKGDLLLVKETDAVSEGDIVVYQSGHSLIVHRVIRVEGDKITTKGDANNVADEPFDSRVVKGVAIGWIPYAGVVVNALKSPVGIIAILACAFLLVELSFRKQKERDSQDLEAIKAEIRRLREEQNSEEREQ